MKNVHVNNVEVNDLVYFDNIKIIQNNQYFKFSLDSILLPNFVKIDSNKKNIIDFCTGNGPVPLVLSTKTKSKIVAVELQPEIYNLAKENIRINNLESQIEVINTDVKNLPSLYESDTFDIITCNPPYFKINENSKLNSNDVKSIARHEISINLEDVIKISKKLLKNNGDLYLVHKTDRLIDIIYLMKKNNIEPKRLRFVYPKENSESNLILIMGKKNGKTGLKVEKPLVVHNDDGSYTSEVIKIFGGQCDTKKL